MAGDSHGDVSSTLSDLERKLRDLEHQLQSVSHAPGSSPAPAAPTARPSLVPAPPPLESAAPAAGDGEQLLSAARSRIEGLSAEIDELRRFGEQLQHATRELVEEYDRVLSRVQPQDAEGEGAQWPAPVAPQGPFPAPAPSAAPFAVLPPAAVPAPPFTAPAPPFTAPAPVAASPAPLAPSPADAMSFDGAVVIDAGPFSDIATLSTFEQTLGQVSGVQDVYVRGFEGNRALVDMRLMTPIALVAELRRLLPQPFAVTEARAGHLSLNVDPPPTHVA